MNNLVSNLKHFRSAIKHWWVFLLIGILFTALGIWVIREPRGAYLGLAVLFAVTMLVSGLLQIFFSLFNRDSLSGWGWILFLGILELILGIYLVSNMAVTLMVLELFVGFWMLFRSIDLIMYSVKMNSSGIPNWGWLLTLGILTMIFSFMVLANPFIGAFYIIFMTAFALLMAGITYIMLAFKMKSLNSKLDEMGHKTA